MSKYLTPVEGATLLADCTVAANGGLVVNALIEATDAAIAAGAMAFNVTTLGATTAGEMMEHLSGSASTGFTPAGIAADSDGNVYVTSTLGVAKGAKMAFSGFLTMN